ncbi:unnamed protein product [marine sediment metagenome]|uniref:Uncharacterized protein n=1 Tax=marine sediment metagenome TaxID=412755 RepID=X0YV63_9ZZZZ
MTVQRAYLSLRLSIHYKFAHKRICDEMPLCNNKAKKWFLWKKTPCDYDSKISCWGYVGYFDTEAEMLQEGLK